MVLLLGAQLVVELQLWRLSVENLRLAVRVLSRAGSDLDATLVDAVSVELEVVVR